MKRLMMMMVGMVAVVACVGLLVADGPRVDALPGPDVVFSGRTFYPDGTLAFSGGNAVMTNVPGFYEFSAPSVGNWAGNLTQPLTFTGVKATPQRVSEQVSGAFPANMQYCYRAMWHVPAAGTYSFAGTFDDGIWLKIDDEVILNLHVYNQRAVRRDVPLAQGWHAIELRCSNGGGSGGRPANWPSGIIYSPANLDFTNDTNLPSGRVFGDAGDVMTPSDEVNHIYGRMLMNNNGAITVNTGLFGEPVFCGIVQSPANETLTLTDWNGPLLFGSPEPLYPAVLDGNLPNALILTNYAWLCRLPASHTVAPDATLAFDGIASPDAVGGNLTLNAYSLQMLESTLGASAVTVPAGRTLSFKSRVYDNGRFVERPAAFSTDITLNGGTVVFTNTQPMTFAGTFSGTGAMRKDGTNALMLAGSGAGCSATLALNQGELILSNATALCGATAHLNGGRLCNFDNLTLSSPVTAFTGGFSTPAGTAFEITSAIIGTGAVSKWGAGTLRLSGNADNTSLQLHARGGTVELDKSSGYALANIGDIEPGVTVKITGASGNQIADTGRIQTSGGTFDLNGHNETVAAITNTVAGSVILNNGNQPATLTVGANNASPTFANATLRDGTGGLALTKVGTGTLTLAPETPQYTGATTVDNGTLRLLPNDYISTTLIRLTIIAARPIPDPNPGTGGPGYYGTGVQFSEFQLMYRGAGLSWPLGQMTVQTVGGNPSGGEGVASAVDNNTGTKWYSSTAYPLPVSMTVTLNQPMVFDGYRLATANDAPGRDPNGWTLEAGTVDGVTTNWVQVDAQAGYNMTTSRNTYTPTIPITFSESNPLLAGMPIMVNPDGTLLLPGFTRQPIGGLTGTGTLALDNNSTIVLPHPEAFTGKIAGSGTIVFNSTTNEISVHPISNGLTLMNDGSPATLLNNGTGTNTWSANVADGTAPLGITQASGTTCYTALNSTYTGDTLLSGGEAIVGGAMTAQYIRFTPLVTNPTGVNHSGIVYQISRFWMMLAGQVVPYPPGTTVYGEAGNGSGEPVSRVILPDLPVGNSKFYTGLNVPNPIVVVLPSTMLFDGYTWYTGNDSTGRDPITWTVETSFDRITWTLVDRRENEVITDTRNAKAGEWLLGMVHGAFCAFSPDSRMNIASGAKLSIIRATEPVGPLLGNGLIALDGGTLRLCTFTDAVFNGTVSGNGTLVKQGAATQTLTGALSYNGNLIVEAGVLNLDGAVLTGITNIILRGGILTGSATVNGNLAVTCEGGVYDATLRVSGTLTIDGIPALILPDGAQVPYRKQLFTYGSIDPASLAALRTAADALKAALQEAGRGHFLVTIGLNNGISLTISRGGTIVLLR